MLTMCRVEGNRKSRHISNASALLEVWCAANMKGPLNTLNKARNTGKLHNDGHELKDRLEQNF
jgi:hypothetical protein